MSFLFLTTFAASLTVARGKSDVDRPHPHVSPEVHRELDELHPERDPRYLPKSSHCFKCPACCRHGRRLEAKPDSLNEFLESWACKVPMEASHQFDDLKDLKELPESLETLAQEPIQSVEEHCFGIAYENIVQIALRIQEDPRLRSLLTAADGRLCPVGTFDSDRTCRELGQWCDEAGCLACEHCVENNFMDDKCPECSDEMVRTMSQIITIIEAKQCLAYVELAKRVNPELLVWGYINNDSEPRQRDSACGFIVNSVNNELHKSNIEGSAVVEVAEEDMEIMLIEDFVLGDRLSALEVRTGLSDVLRNLITHWRYLGVVAGASMLAQVCSEWKHQALETLRPL